MPPMLDWNGIISAGVGPIIVISACGLLCLAFYNRFSTLVARIRSMHREQFEQTDRLSRAKARPDEASQDQASQDIVRAQELLGMLKVQTERLGRRARLIRGTLMCLLATIGYLSACSLCLGLSAICPPLARAAAVLFVVGMVTMIIGVALAMVELLQALDPVELESRFVSDLAHDAAADLK